MFLFHLLDYTNMTSISEKTMNNNKYFIYILMCANALMLSSCGVKPPYVDPPQGAQHDTFPNTYPDASTDPKPGLERKDY